LQGPPALHQGWSQFRREIEGHARTSDGFTAVQVPIRVGDPHQLNDGLVGYWIENQEDISGPFYSMAQGNFAHPSIVAHLHDDVPIRCAIDDVPLNLTMLLDPRGKVNVASGILPVKTISIPPAQYRGALQQLSLTFLTAPVISPQGHLQISLPKEEGYEWSWVAKTNPAVWEEIKQTVMVSRTLLQTQIPDAPGLWEDLIQRKWLQPTADPGMAMVTAAVHRAFPQQAGGTGPNAPFPIDLAKRIDDFFDAYGKRIEPFEMQAALHDSAVIREGWLKMSPVNPQVINSL
jgi:hypothetical protein